VPVLTFDHREKLRRFINLLDVLYEHHVRLIVSAAANPNELFQPSKLPFEDTTREHETDRGMRAPQSVIVRKDGRGVQRTENSGSGSASSANNGNGNGNGTAAAMASAANREDETFAYSRAVSRLIEMSSVEYLQRTAQKRPSKHA